MTFLKVNDLQVEFRIDKKMNKQVLGDKGNQLRVYKDVATAWDINKNYRLLPSHPLKLVGSEACSYGEVQQILQSYVYGKSRVQQTITLRPGERFIEFSLEVDWQDNQRMLRTSFPLNLQTDEAIFDIQFGHIKRSTLNNTKALKAQYEACGHNWCDMNDGDWGAAVITDSKYGFKAKNNTLDLHLIKSTNYPAKMGDVGDHHIKYGLLIHEKDPITAGVDQFAMAFNTYFPLAVEAVGVFEKPFEVSNDAIIYSTVKVAEDSEDVIARLYERDGSENQTTLKVNSTFSAIYETNMIEEDPRIVCDGTEVVLEFTPFEVKTLLLKKRRTTMIKNESIE